MTNHLKVAITRLRRSPYQTLAAISIMSMSLFLASIFIIIAAGSQEVLKYFETRPQINAYYKEDFVPTSQEIDRLTSQLMSTGLVENVKYISKDDALRIYKEENKGDPLLLEAVTAQMLPASLAVSAKDPQELKNIANMLSRETNISDVRFAADIVDSLVKWTNSIRIVGIALVGTHLLITFAVILVIINIKISFRKEEIKIHQLVGAKSSYISAPFIWEGILYGIIGAIIGWGIAYLIILYSTPFLVTFLGQISLLPPPVNFMVKLLLAQMFLGIFVGGFGGLIAVHRHLRS